MKWLPVSLQASSLSSSSFDTLSHNTFLEQTHHHLSSHQQSNPFLDNLSYQSSYQSQQHSGRQFTNLDHTTHQQQHQTHHQYHHQQQQDSYASEALFAATKRLFEAPQSSDLDLSFTSVHQSTSKPQLHHQHSNSSSETLMGLGGHSSQLGGSTDSIPCSLVSSQYKDEDICQPLSSISSLATTTGEDLFDQAAADLGPLTLRSRSDPSIHTLQTDRVRTVSRTPLPKVHEQFQAPATATSTTGGELQNLTEDVDSALPSFQETYSIKYNQLASLGLKMDEDCFNPGSGYHASSVITAYQPHQPHHHHASHHHHHHLHHLGHDSAAPMHSHHSVHQGNYSFGAATANITANVMTPANESGLHQQQQQQSHQQAAHHQSQQQQYMANPGSNYYSSQYDQHEMVSWKD